MKKKIILAFATLNTLPLIAASCQSKTKNNPQEKQSIKKNESSSQEINQINELKQATKISEQIYREIEKLNPEDKLLISLKPTIQKFYADFEAKLSKEIKSEDVKHLQKEFSDFLEKYLMTIYIKYDYKDLRDHILKTFPDLKDKIDLVDAKFNEISKKNGQDKNEFGALLGNLTVLYADKLLKHLGNNLDADIPLPPESRFSKIYPERYLKEIKVAYSKMYKTVENLVKNKPKYQEIIKKINESLNVSSTTWDYSIALFRLNHLIVKLSSEALNDGEEYTAARDKYNKTYEQAAALFDKENDKSLYEKLTQIHENLSSTATTIELQQATSQIEELIKEKKKTTEPINKSSNTNQ